MAHKTPSKTQMQVLCTMPGKYGDILWSLPTVRAIAQHIGRPVDLMVSSAYSNICPLIERQSYINRCVANLEWIERPDGGPAPFTPYRPDRPAAVDAADTKIFFPADNAGNIIGDYDRIIHLGYQRWPQNQLAYEIYLSAVGQWGFALTESLELDVPWIAVSPAKNIPDTFAGDTDPPVPPLDVLVCWSEEWAELKAGVTGAVSYALHPAYSTTVVRPRHSRYYEWPMGLSLDDATWEQTATWMAKAPVVLTCLSSQWVLANALGRQVVVMEPSEARHNPIFFYDAPRNHLVLGNDDKPTFDARAVVTAVKARLV